MAEFQHTGISVSDLDRSAQWYAAHFGYQETKRFAKPALQIRGAVLMLGNSMLEMLQPDHPIPAPAGSVSLPERLGRLGSNHFAIGVSDVAQCYTSLRQAGATLASELIDGRFFFCTDPDGTLIEVRKL